MPFSKTTPPPRSPGPKIPKEPVILNGPLLIELKIAVPSLNLLFAASLKNRFRIKKAVRDATLSALKVAAADCSTPTTSLGESSSSWIHCVISGSYQTTLQKSFGLSSFKRKFGAKLRKKLSSQ